MSTADKSRRKFLKGAESSLIAASAIGGIGSSTRPAAEAESCVAQSKESQQAITPPIALQMLKDGNARTQTLANI